jgi:hypothetical protein
MQGITLGQAEREAVKLGAVLAGKSYFPKPHQNDLAFVYFFNKDGLDIGHFSPIFESLTLEPKPRVWAQEYKDNLKTYSLEGYENKS